MKKIKTSILLFILSNLLFAQENFNKHIDNLVENNYFISSYFDVLKSQNRDSIKKLGDIFNDITYEEPEGWITRKWYDKSVFSFDNFELIYDLSGHRFDNLFCIGSVTVTVLDFKTYESYSIITLQHGAYYDDQYDACTLLNWEKVRKAESTIVSEKRDRGRTWPRYTNDFIFEEDGDYLFVYYDKEKKIPFATFAKMNQETEEQFKNLIYNNKCDLSKVTWPRHADGTCDYDESKTTTTQTSKEVSSSNVVKNKTMLVSENLKLRSGEATTTQVLTVMAAGTKVKILELGKAETIDSINSNWVKVEVQAGAKDKDGKSIKKGTIGWCYGGYLK
jgi:hypothetical protein